jgi:hypothetical protein
MRRGAAGEVEGDSAYDSGEGAGGVQRVEGRLQRSGELRRMLLVLSRVSAICRPKTLLCSSRPP